LSDSGWWLTRLRALHVDPAARPWQEGAGAAGLHGLTVCDAVKGCDVGRRRALAARVEEVGTVDGSLYERLGGVDAITAVTRAAVDRQMKDDRINQKYARTNVDRLIKEFVDQICEATGGPCKYTGRNMTETHHNMGVTNGEFQAFVEDVVAVLDDFKVGKAEQDELLNILAPLRGEIVEVDSNQTGTPLPSEFTPAPAL
jgi:hemoglobin